MPVLIKQAFKPQNYGKLRSAAAKNRRGRKLQYPSPHNEPKNKEGKS